MIALDRHTNPKKKKNLFYLRVGISRQDTSQSGVLGLVGDDRSCFVFSVPLRLLEAEQPSRSGAEISCLNYLNAPTKLASDELRVWGY